MPNGASATANSALIAVHSGMSTAANNISNVDTVGYKTEGANFTTMVAGSSNPNAFSSGGVRAKPTRHTAEQGLLKATVSPTDLAISGNGFFVIKRFATVATNEINPVGLARGMAALPDNKGFLVTPYGWYLQGWPTDTNGVPTVSDTNSLTQLETIRLNQLSGISTPTSEMDVRLNLPASDAVGATHSSTREIYDSLGIAHSLRLDWLKTTTSPIRWNLTVSVPGGTVTQTNGAGAAYTIPVEFDGAGQPVSFNGQPTPPNIFINWAHSANDNTITLDLGAAFSANAISSKEGPYNATLLDQNGKGVGQPSGVEINSDGLVSALFNNGQRLIIYKIPLANVAAKDKLSLFDDGVFGLNESTGTTLLSSAKTSGMGSIQSNALEQSTVKLSNEFIRMMDYTQLNSAAVNVIRKDQEQFDDLRSLFR